nr:hypothetical protein [Microvirgula aerodenitrificans]
MASLSIKRPMRFPTAFTILFAILLLAIGMTWIIPAGSYSRLAYLSDSHTLQITTPHGVTEKIPASQQALTKLNINIGLDKFADGTIRKPIAIPGTYERLQQQPKGLGDITVSMVKGTIEGADIIVFILVLGGLIGVVNKTGAFDAGLVVLAQKTKGNEFLFVMLVCMVMTLGGPPAVWKRRRWLSIRYWCRFSWRSAMTPLSASARSSWPPRWGPRSRPSTRSRW